MWGSGILCRTLCDLLEEWYCLASADCSQLLNDVVSLAFSRCVFCFIIQEKLISLLFDIFGVFLFLSYK